MKTIKIGDKEVKIYYTCKELPMRVYNTMQGYLIQDVGIGSDMAAVAKHFSNLDILLQQGKVVEAAAERSNLHYNIYMAMEGLDFKSMAFACMIYSVDGVKVEDYSEEALKELLQSFGNDITYHLVEDTIDEVKKNFIRN